MNTLLLRLVSVLIPFLERTGVDTYQLYQILRIKLMMDDRRPNAMFAGRRKAAATGKTSNPWLVSIGTMVMGGLTGLILIVFKGPLIAQTIYFSMFMVLMSMTLIADFTSVLLDVRDQYILLPRPVNDRTLALSRILHISVYVFRLALLQGIGGVIIIGFIDGLPAVPLFIVQLILITFLSILLVNVVYLIMMHTVSPEKFKDIISYFQIVFSVVIFGCYYLLPRVIDFTSLVQIDLTQKVWAYFLPPVWIASLNEVLIHPSRATLLTSLLAIIGITAPIVGLWLVAKVLAPGFNKRLAIAATSDGNTSAPTVVATNSTTKPNSSLVNQLAKRLAPDPVENAGFNITWKLAARIREFKIKVYPALAYVPIYFLYFGLNGKGSIDERFDKIQSGSSYIFLVYLSTFVLSSILQHISYSEKFKPAWVYYALPISQPGKILSGMYKAVVTLYYLPYCFIIGVVGVVIWGPKVINDIILASVIGMIYGLLMALFMVKGLPFSKPVLLKQSGGRVVKSLLITGLIGAVGFGHYLLSRWEMVIWILVIPAVAIYWIMIYYYKRQGWDSIELEEF